MHTMFINTTELKFFLRCKQIESAKKRECMEEPTYGIRDETSTP